MAFGPAGSEVNREIPHKEYAPWIYFALRDSMFLHFPPHRLNLHYRHTRSKSGGLLGFPDFFATSAHRWGFRQSTPVRSLPFYWRYV